MTLPILFSTLALLITGIGLAHLLFWRRLRPAFWLCCALLAVGTGYLAATGRIEPLALAYWSLLDPEAQRAIERSFVGRFDTSVGMMLIGIPLVVGFLFVSWRHNVVLPRPILLMGALVVLLLHMSSIPAKLARAVLSDEVVDDLSRQLATKLELR